MRFEDAVAALVDSLGERAFDAQSTLGREGEELVRLVAGKVAERWSADAFIDVLLERPWARRTLGLPAPEEAFVVARTLARLRAGHRFHQGGADDGGQSDRGVSGGWQELYLEGDHFVHEEVDFHEPRGGPREERRRRVELDEAGLRDALHGNSGLRALVGLG